MEELEINPEGEGPQQPEAASPDQTEGVSPDQTEGVSPDQTEGVSPDQTAAATTQEPESATAQAQEMPPAALGPIAPEPPAASISMEELLAQDAEAPTAAAPMEDVQLMAVLEAVVYVAEEPLTLAQIAAALAQPAERVGAVLRQLIAELEKPEHGIAIREVAGGFKMATKAEHHEAVRSFVKGLKPPMKLSLPALETLAVIAYKQPVTAPEIMEIRGVQGTGVLKTLLDRKLIAVAGRKNVIGKPILYKTTRDFLIQFGLNDVSELPSLKEFEDIRRMAFADSESVESGPLATEASKPEAAAQETAEQDTAKQETAKQDTAKQDTAKLETAKLETPGADAPPAAPEPEPPVPNQES
jgi:segregation and condensation protein B